MYIGPGEFKNISQMTSQLLIKTKCFLFFRAENETSMHFQPLTINMHHVSLNTPSTGLITVLYMTTHRSLHRRTSSLSTFCSLIILPCHQHTCISDTQLTRAHICNFQEQKSDLNENKSFTPLVSDFL